jgi:hypothetical protein
MNSDDQDRIYNAIRELLKVYVPPFEVQEGKNVSGKDSYSLTKHGDFVVDGRKRDEMWFAGVIKQKSYVGFYFMPIYTEPEAMKKVFSERLLKTLKGKSCFYIKTDDAQMLTDIKHALDEGFKLYKTRGWVS